MAEILLFHHAYGLTDGLRGLAARLSAEGHTVHTPDCYAGTTFKRLDDGVRHAQRIGHDAVEDVARRSAREHRSATVVMGFSLGAMQAQILAQDLRRIRGCLLMGGALPPKSLGGAWRSDVALEIHLADPDEWVDPAELESLLYHAPNAHVYRYPNKGHLFVDPCSREYDADAADLFEERLESWLADLDERAAEEQLAARQL
jgi:dienelactone hydrolase